MAFRLSRRPSRQHLLIAFICLSVFFFVTLHIGKSDSPTIRPKAPVIQAAEPDVNIDYVKPDDHENLEDIRIDTSREEETSENQRKLIDRKYCGRDNCRFVLPITITEQGTSFFLVIWQLWTLPKCAFQYPLTPPLFTSQSQRLKCTFANWLSFLVVWTEQLYYPMSIAHIWEFAESTHSASIILTSG